jgi:alkyl hydroperoxide reductase subunit AhpF
MDTLRLSSVQGEFYNGDKPGTLQYRKNSANLANLVISDAVDNKDMWTETRENHVAKLLPNTKTAGLIIDWDSVLVMQKSVGNTIWLKGALRNKQTGNIALMTSCSNKEGITVNGHRAIQSQHDGWFVGHYRMAAPLSFWQKLKTIFSNS